MNTGPGAIEREEAASNASERAEKERAKGGRGSNPGTTPPLPAETHRREGKD